jgi:hypothetical protein
MRKLGHNMPFSHVLGKTVVALGYVMMTTGRESDGGCG